MRKPLVSVIIPVYNRAQILKDTLKSVLQQSYTNIEILVVDDGSTEDIKAVVAELADNRIIYFRREHKNADAARNYGILNAKGEFIAMLDSDDIWLKEHLSYAYQLITHTGADGVYGSIIINNLTYGRTGKVIARSLYKHETMADYLLTMGCGAATSTLFLTTQSAKDILWDETITNNDDYDFLIRYNRKYRMAVQTIPSAIYNMRIRTECDFESCINFINKHRNDISNQSYYIYHKNMLYLARVCDVNNGIIEHYIREVTRFKEMLSFEEYIKLKFPKNKIMYIWYKIQYLWYVGFFNSEL